MFKVLTYIERIEVLEKDNVELKKKIEEINKSLNYLINKNTKRK